MPTLLVMMILLVLQVSPAISMQVLVADRETIIQIDMSGKLVQCSAAVDILLLMDGSYSIGKASFERSKHFASNLCNMLDINPDRVQLGIVQYSSKPRLEFALDVYPTREEAKEAIARIAFRGGGTETGRSIKYVLRKGFLGGREGIPKILVLLTDGKSQDNATLAAKHARNSGLTVFAVGIRHPAWEELNRMASDPDDMHVFYAEHYNDALNGLYTTLTQATVCSDVHPSCKVESRICLRTSVESVQEYRGSHACWKGKRGQLYGKPYATFCPYYAWKRIRNVHQSRCYRTLCPDPCDPNPCQNGGTCVAEGVEAYSCLCPLGFGSHRDCGGTQFLVPSVAADCAVDLLFLVDGSWSMGLEGFLRAKAFVKRVIHSLLQTSPSVLIGFMQYSDTVHVEFTLGQHAGYTSLVRSIDAIKYRGGNTNTGGALAHVAQLEFRAETGSRQEVPHAVVVLTNSRSRDAVAPPAQFAREREIFLLAVGSEQVRAELQSIATPLNALPFSDPLDLYNKVMELRSRICSLNSQGCYSRPLDVIFVLDSSASIGRQNFRSVKEFVKDSVSQFDIDRDLAQVAAVIYSTKPRALFHLDTYDSESRMKRALSTAPFLGGLALIGRALGFVADELLTVHRGARPGVRKVVVVVTDGLSADDVVGPVTTLLSNGVSVILVSVGDANRRLWITAQPSDVISIPSYNTLKHYMDNVIWRICEESKQPTSPCLPNPCTNGGMCSLLTGSYHCQCVGWDGPHCEHRIRRHDVHAGYHYTGART
ncbi:von Willebrand factor A domain-containing protein 2 [Petromyzon marinus]|uniref:von Willebrand factor A domain-containing protein 2 n=1 Tax=Petromyzon marinus TaxID=7757 RepID=A0AAJ7WQW8_PETMA|nr:von Willebrand factor A domain-containing protein 2 [Petromyzon marinus]XP_032806498.1 von Willebrand factor A domain-containing protein 2 [Petromyzon marinus]